MIYFLVFCLDSYDCAVLSVSSFIELHCTCNLSKECIISTTAAVFTSVNLCAVLTDDDFASLYKLSTIPFDAKALSIGITTIAA